MPKTYTKPPETIPTPCCIYRNTHITTKNKDKLLRTANILKVVHGWRCRIIPIVDIMLWHLYIAEDDLNAEQVAALLNFTGPYAVAKAVLNAL